jgi:hypothetical protein
MIKARLLSIMRRELDAQNLQLTSECQQQIEQLLVNGVSRMRINKAIDHPGHILQAERNMKALIQYFCDYAREVDSYPNLNSADFSAAMIVCPSFWPFSSSE